MLLVQRIAVKAFFCMTRSYMSPEFDTAPWLASILSLLKQCVHVAELDAASASATAGGKEDEGMGMDDDMEEEAGDNAVWRLHKRCMQVLLNFQARHRSEASYKRCEKEALALAQRGVKVRRGRREARLRLPAVAPAWSSRSPRVVADALARPGRQQGPHVGPRACPVLRLPRLWRRQRVWLACAAAGAARDPL